MARAETVEWARLPESFCAVEKEPMNWISTAITENDVAYREFTVMAEGRKVPGVLWTPVNTDERMPMLLAGHGGSGHKRQQLVLDFAVPLARDRGCAVAAIDGPVHGGRRATFEEGPVVRDEFLSLWRDGDGGIDSMAADWSATVDMLCGLPEINANAIGYYGVSMGTALGLPLCAAEPRIRAAVLGMWGLSYPNSERLARRAPNVRCPVLFMQKWDDEWFTRDSQLALFDKLGSREKRLNVYMGGHDDPCGEQLRDVMGFLLKHLTTPGTPTW